MLDKNMYIAFIKEKSRNEVIIEINQLEQFLEEIRAAVPDEESINKLGEVRDKIHIIHDELQQGVM